MTGIPASSAPLPHKGQPSFRLMKVKNWMKTSPVTIARTALLQDAAQLMTTNGIRHLPVTEGDQLVGFITESDLRQFSFPAMVEEIPVH